MNTQLSAITSPNGWRTVWIFAYPHQQYYSRWKTYWPEAGFFVPQPVSMQSRFIENDAMAGIVRSGHRIEPSYNDLSSFVSYNDPMSVFTGNPLLQPSITNNLKFDYVYKRYSFSLLLSRMIALLPGTRSLRALRASWLSSFSVERPSFSETTSTFPGLRLPLKVAACVEYELYYAGQLAYFKASHIRIQAKTLCRKIAHY